jgi:hypothetical protein
VGDGSGMTGPGRLAAGSYHEDRCEPPEVLLARSGARHAGARCRYRAQQGQGQPQTDADAWFACRRHQAARIARRPRGRTTGR